MAWRDARFTRSAVPLWIAASATPPRNDEGDGPSFCTGSSLRACEVIQERWTLYHNDGSLAKLQRDFQPAVYLMASGRNGTLYAGVTSNLRKRAYEHREGIIDGFSKQHGCKLLAWFELHATMEHAITREKQLKAGSRKRKLALIEAGNPTWRDLFDDICR